MIAPIANRTRRKASFDKARQVSPTPSQKTSLGLPASADATIDLGVEGGE
jgi:hypothetical protein